ncbi:MAG: hypothetical protein ACD_28C00328G0003 [uncultured bacterium]|nr:MAG: hypothetical protein ACD_28C00328G0003 [uncultured bacterium]
MASTPKVAFEGFGDEKDRTLDDPWQCDVKHAAAVFQTPEGEKRIPMNQLDAAYFQFMLSATYEKDPDYEKSYKSYYRYSDGEKTRLFDPSSFTRFSR